MRSIYCCTLYFVALLLIATAFNSPVFAAGGTPPVINSASLSPSSIPLSGGAITITADITDAAPGASISYALATIYRNGQA